MHAKDWMSLQSEFGLIRFRAALERAWLTYKFFPKPGEIRDCIPAQEDFDPKRTVPRCKFCVSNDGFVQVPGKRNLTVVKCRHEGQRIFQVPRSSDGHDLDRIEARVAAGAEIFSLKDVFDDCLEQWEREEKPSPLKQSWIDALRKIRKERQVNA